MLVNLQLPETRAGSRCGWRAPGGLRRGFSLLEVLTALAIFLISLVGIGQLISQSGDRAQEAQQLGQATLLCQAKLAEVMAGSVPLASQGDAPCDEDTDYRWSLDCNASSVTNLWSVQVRVSRIRADDKLVQCTLSQMVLDPSQRGSAADNPQASIASSSSASGSSASSSSGSGGSSSQGSSSMSGGTSSKPAASKSGTPAAGTSSKPAAPTSGGAPPASSKPAASGGAPAAAMPSPKPAAASPPKSGAPSGAAGPSKSGPPAKGQ